MVLIPQDRQRSSIRRDVITRLQRPPAPPNDEAPGKVAMRDDDDVFGIFPLFVTLRVYPGIDTKAT
jgi:hypothetical protein